MSINKTPSKRVAIYVRVSTDDQLDGYGADTQKQSVLNLIKAKENTPAPLLFAGDNYIYFDEGVSGTVDLDERPAFARLKEDILLSTEDTRPFDVVAVYRIDRFARKLKVLLEVIDFFETHDIEFLSVTENIDTSSPFGKAILSIIGVIAELEIDTIKQRTQAGREQALKSGVFMGKAPPYGYIKTPEKKLRIQEQESKWVDEIFQMFVYQRLSFAAITEELKKNKVVSPDVAAVIHRKRKGTHRKVNSSFHWTSEAIRRILRNEIYTGVYYYNRYSEGKLLPKQQWKKAPYLQPQIIDLLTFQKAQDLIEASKKTKSNPKRRETPYLLGGLLTCDYCQKFRQDTQTRQHWVGVPKKIKGSNNYSYYYYCGRKRSRRYEHRCDVLPLPGETLEAFVISYCIDLLKSPVSVFKHQQQLKSQALSRSHVQNKMSQLQELLSTIPVRKKTLLEQHEFGYLSLSDLQEKIEGLNQSEKDYNTELKNLQKEFTRTTLSRAYLSALDVFGRKYQSMLQDVQNNPNEVKRVLSLLIDEIVVYARPVTKDDVIAGRKTKNQQIPSRIHIRLRLPKDILNEISLEKNPVIIKNTSLMRDGSTSENGHGGR